MFSKKNNRKTTIIQCISSIAAISQRMLQKFISWYYIICQSSDLDFCHYNNFLLRSISYNTREVCKRTCMSAI